jgi:hypothetical protein
MAAIAARPSPTVPPIRCRSPSALAASTLGLPYFADMDLDQVNRVAMALAEALGDPAATQAPHGRGMVNRTLELAIVVFSHG